MPATPTNEHRGLWEQILTDLCQRLADDETISAKLELAVGELLSSGKKVHASDIQDLLIDAERSGNA
jgi:hypothetical protein